jgi:pimeloyl-ACP methyl ester carboxylesterase
MVARNISEAPILYEKMGGGEPLLLVHGLLATGEMFGPVLDAFARHHTVIVPDLRGYGRSMHLEGPSTVEQHVRDLIRLLDHLDIRGADVLGYSQGGAVALQIVHDHPERVRRLVLVNTFAHNGLAVRERLENRVSLWALRLLGTGTLARIAARAVAGEGKPLTPEQARRLREMLASSNRKRSVEEMRAMISFDARPWLEAIASPALIIRGSEDTAVPRPHAQMLADGIQDARLVVIEGAGHALVWTHPKELVEEVERWLKKPGPAHS